MKGTFLHTHAMAQPVANALRLKGFDLFEELPVLAGPRPPSVDLACKVGGQFLLFEFERGSARVARDVAKAERLGAKVLSIVVPTAKVRTQVKAALRRQAGDRTDPTLRIQVLTLGAALNWIANNCPMPPYSRTGRRTSSSGH